MPNKKLAFYKARFGEVEYLDINGIDHKTIEEIIKAIEKRYVLTKTYYSGKQFFKKFGIDSGFLFFSETQDCLAELHYQRDKILSRGVLSPDDQILITGIENNIECFDHIDFHQAFCFLQNQNRKNSRDLLRKYI